MKQVSAGSSTLWAVSEDESLYFREGVTNHYPEGNITQIIHFLKTLLKSF